MNCINLTIDTVQNMKTTRVRNVLYLFDNYEANDLEHYQSPY